MAKRSAEEISKDAPVEEEAHPYAFHVSGPRNVSSPNWRDLISSSWSAYHSQFLVFLVEKVASFSAI